MPRLLQVLIAICAAATLCPAHAADATLDLGAHRGQVVYLDFWTSWCVPCRKSFPWMNAMQAKYAREGLVIISVNLDEQRADADRFLRRTPAEFTVVFDPGGKLAESYGLIGMPSSLLIGRNGEIYQRHAGFTENSPLQYESELKGLLAERP